MRTDMSATSSPRSESSVAVRLGRRSFLAGAAAAGVTLATMPADFAAAAAGQTGPRSLVCVFLAGGADSFNLLIPRDHAVAGQTHGDYARTRGDFAVPARDLVPFGDGAFGLNPMLTDLEAATRGRMAVVANVGPLERPTTKADYDAERSLPQSLFAHDAQQKLWQTGRSELTSSQGWGGSIAAAVANNGVLPPSFSINGSSIFQTEAGAGYTTLSPTVAIERLLGYDPSLRRWLPTFEGLAGVMEASLHSASDTPSRFDRVAARTIRQSILTTEQLQEATSGDIENDVGMDDVSGHKLGGQLRKVAQLIKNRDTLGMDRQIFFVRMGGWDTHRAQQEFFPRLVGELNQSLASFQTALDDLGVSDTVTTFTASDFGRTLTINGDGTDHGWGGHAFVIGGAVKPGVYGTFPHMRTSNNPDDVGDRNRQFAGRLIPTTSVSQYAATLAGWMGLSPAQLELAFPELANFSQSSRPRFL